MKAKRTLLIILFMLVNTAFVFAESTTSPKNKKPSTGVSIHLDKTTFSLGEKITAVLNIENTIYVFGGKHWSIHKWKNDSWEKIATSGCKPFNYCDELPIDKKSGYPNCIMRMCEAPAWMSIDNTHPYYLNFTWDQKYIIGEKDIQCKPMPPARTSMILDSVCFIPEYALPGKYKIRVDYAESIEEVGNYNADKKYTEREFEILQQ